MRLKLAITVLLSLLAAMTGVSAEDQLSMDTVIGQAGPNAVMCGTPLEFHIRLSNDTARIKGLSHGFWIHSPEDACWEPLGGEWNPAYDWNEIFDLTVMTRFHSITGCDADSIGFAASVLMGPALPSGWDGIIFHLFTSVECAEIGRTICIDSTYYSPSQPWMWAFGSGIGSLVPSWGGPYCYEIVSCCQGIRGNVDGDPDDLVDISDLIYLADWMFSDFGGDPDDHGPPPPCMDEADVDGSGSQDISDLVYLVDYMFMGGPAPQPP